MKSRELIRLLQEEDPTGEVEVCIGNADIYFLETKAAWWDGTLQTLIHDESKKPYYSIVGVKYVRSGSKIDIQTMSVKDFLWDNPDGFVDYSELTSPTLERYKEADDKIRQAALDCDKRVEMDAFFDWVKKKAIELNGDIEYLREETDAFYNAHLSPKDPLKVLPLKTDQHGTWRPSISERRESGWDDTIAVNWIGDWELRKKENV